jgi:predicted SAM-dependent methyltransferase
MLVHRSDFSEMSLNLNIGAGGYVIPGFLSLDTFSDHYYKSREHFLKERVEYDMSLDGPIPFEDSSVDNIYISHVIEHCDDLMVYRFLVEAFRVLRPRGVLRTACPDFKFLFEVMQSPSPWFLHYIELKFRCTKTFDLFEAPTPEDFLVHNAATARCRFYKNRIADVVYPSDVKHLDYPELMQFLKKGLEYRRSFPQDHVNAWDYDRLANMSRLIGFSRVIQSKQNACLSAAMRGHKFDRNTHDTSLYVDFVK